MNILTALKQLRDDIKTWVTNNLRALSAKIDEKTVPIDDKLDSNSTNPVQNKAVTQAINNIPRFSGDYNDLTNAPIIEDGSGNLIIADETGNIIFQVDKQGISTTELTVKEGKVATEGYVDNAIAGIPTPDVSGQIEAHNTSATAHSDIRQEIVDVKEELSESIVTESNEWKVVDEAGNIIFSVDESGAHTTALTLGDDAVATQKWVEENTTTIDTSDFVTKSTDQQITGKKEVMGYTWETKMQIPGDNNYSVWLDTFDNVTAEGGERPGIVLLDYQQPLYHSYEFPVEEWSQTANSREIIATREWASEWMSNQISISYTYSGVSDIYINAEDHAYPVHISVGSGANNPCGLKVSSYMMYNDEIVYSPTGIIGKLATNTGDSPSYLITNLVFPRMQNESTSRENTLTLPDEEDATIATQEWTEETLKRYTTAEYVNNTIQNMQEEISDSITSNNSEFHIVDNQGNIVASINESGLTTTAVNAQTILINGKTLEEIINQAVENALSNLNAN